MLSYDQASVRREDNESGWLYSHFHQACASLLKKPSSRRGPFLIDEKELREMHSDKGDRKRDQSRGTKDNI